MSDKTPAQCFHFQGIFLVLAKSKEFWTPQGIFQGIPKVKGISRKFGEREGNYSEILEIQRNLNKMQVKWIKFKEIHYPEAFARFARSRISFEHVIAAEKNYKRS